MRVKTAIIITLVFILVSCSLVAGAYFMGRRTGNPLDRILIDDYRRVIEEYRLDSERARGHIESIERSQAEALGYLNTSAVELAEGIRLLRGTGDIDRRLKGISVALRQIGVAIKEAIDTLKNPVDSRGGSNSSS